MAKVKPVVSKSKTGIDGKTNIKIRLTHQSKAVDISTPYYIDPKFMGKDGIIKKSYPNYSPLNIALGRTIIDFNRVIDEQGPEIRNMDIKTLAGKLKRNEHGGASFTRHCQERIAELEKEGRLSYKSTYESTLSNLRDFTGKKDILYKEVTFDFLQRFERYLSLKGCRVNTIKIYMNDIKALFNIATISDRITLPSPFIKYKVKAQKGQKKALDKVTIRKLFVGPYHIAQQRAVDVAKLIFCLAGINLKDLLYMKHDQVKGGYIFYRRMKITDQEIDLRVKILPEAEELLLKYRGKKYLLNFLDEDDSFDKYKNFMKETNKKLKWAAQHCGIKENITTYSFRHSWATFAYSLDVSKSDIDLALGHSLNTMTDVYLDYNKLMSRIDAANLKVITDVIR